MATTKTWTLGQANFCSFCGGRKDQMIVCIRFFYLQMGSVVSCTKEVTRKLERAKEGRLFSISRLADVLSIF